MPLDTSRNPLMRSIEPAYPLGTLHEDQLTHSGYTMSTLSPYQVIPCASLPRLGQIMDMYPWVKIGDSRHVLPNYRFSWARACPQQQLPHSGYTMSAISPCQVIPGASLPRLGQIMDMYPWVKIGESRHLLPNYRFSWARACPQ